MGNYNLRAWAEINLDNLEFNYNSIRSCLKKETKFMAVVKADGYGHGAVQLAKHLDKLGADYFAVATFDEAVQLRKHNIEKPVLVLGTPFSYDIDNILDYNIIPTVYDYEFARELSKKAVLKGKKVKIHIKIDSGMGRIGFLCGDDYDTFAVAEIEKISKLDNIEIEGIYTHFATADEEDTQKTKTQFNKFVSLTNKLKEKGIDIKIRHCANSAAIIYHKEMHLDMVRAGIILYGQYPSEIVAKQDVKIKPVMTLKTLVVNVKTVEKDSEISYGGIFKAKNTTKIATIGIGYADGLLRTLSEKLSVRVNGQDVKQIGRICMDQCMIDVTNVNNIVKGEEIVIFGEDKPVEELAKVCSTISYEILCMVGKRLTRVYLKGGKVVKTLNL